MRVFCFFVRLCQNLRIFSSVSQLVKTKRRTNFKDFKGFGVCKGLVEQKNLVCSSFVCKLGFFWHDWVSLKRNERFKGLRVPKKAQFTQELVK
jgi:hypothetical protein